MKIWRNKKIVEKVLSKYYDTIITKSYISNVSSPEGIVLFHTITLKLVIIFIYFCEIFCVIFFSCLTQSGNFTGLVNRGEITVGLKILNKNNFEMDLEINNESDFQVV